MATGNIEQLKQSVFLRTLIALAAVGATLVIAIMMPLGGDLKAKNDREVHFIVDAKRVSVDQFIAKIINVAEQFSSRTEIRRKLTAYNEGQVTREELVAFSHDKLLDAMKKSVEAIGITRLDVSGEVAVVVGRPLPEAFLPAFDRALERTTVYDPVTLDGAPHIIVATPILDRGRDKVGIDIVLFRTDALKAIIQDYASLGASGEVLLGYGPEGRFVSLFETRHPYDPAVLGAVREAFVAGRFPASESRHPVCPECVVVIRAVDHTDWHLLFRMDAQELNAIIDATMVRLLVIAALVLVAGMMGIYLLTSPLLRSLAEELKERTRAEAELRQLNDELEGRVAERTTALERQKQAAEVALARQQAMQEELVQAEKLAALGGLVAGIAHEINTPVGVALSAATHLDSETRKTDALYRAGELTEEGLTAYFATAGQASQLLTLNSQRAADLIQSFKQVAVDQTGGERRRFELAAYIDEVLLSLQPRLKKTRIEVDVDCPDELVLDSLPGALSQVLTNLVINSLVHAFEPGQAGRIAIAAAADGDWVEIVYRDDGRGIPAELHGKVFEPFFTTGRASGGSGLGLHIVHNLVTQSLKGTLSVASAPGEGTTFTLRVPRILPDTRQEFAREPHASQA